MNSNYLDEKHEKHSVVLQDRNKLNIDGVIDVIDFDSTMINLNSCMGLLSVEGESLKIISVSKDDAKIYVEGKIDSIFYYGVSDEKKGGFFRKRGK